MKKMQLLNIAVSVIAIIIFVGCGSSAMISNVGVPGSAQDPQTNQMGKNSSLRYFSKASVDDACSEQIKILENAKWTVDEELKKSDTYSKVTYTDGKTNMVLLCSETDLSATEKGTKVTLTWMQNP